MLRYFFSYSWPENGWLIGSVWSCLDLKNCPVGYISAGAKSWYSSIRCIKFFRWNTLLAGRIFKSQWNKNAFGIRWLTRWFLPRSFTSVKKEEEKRKTNMVYPDCQPMFGNCSPVAKLDFEFILQEGVRQFRKQNAWIIASNMKQKTRFFPTLPFSKLVFKVSLPP